MLSYNSRYDLERFAFSGKQGSPKFGSNLLSQDIPWLEDMLRNCYFWMTTLTTIGYGDLTPLDKNNKIFVMTYGLFALALMGKCIGALSEILASSLLQSSEYLRKKLKTSNSSKTAFMTSPISLAVYLLVLELVAGSLTFRHLENWTYFDGLYYQFITMTTIGYGDFAPKSHLGMGLFVIFSTFYLATFAMLIAILDRAVTDKASAVVRKSRFMSKIKPLPQGGSPDENAKMVFPNPFLRIQIPREATDRIHTLNREIKIEEALECAEPEIEAYIALFVDRIPACKIEEVVQRIGTQAFAKAEESRSRTN